MSSMYGLEPDPRPVTRFDARDTAIPAATADAAWPDWPEYGLTTDLLPSLETWHAQGRRIALATLASVAGSSPRPPGSEMAINDSGEIDGYVSGGCVEAAVAAQARQVIASGRAIWLDYGAGSPVLDIQLTCGGRIGIYVRALADAGDYIARWRAARRQRRAFSVSIDLNGGGCRYDAGAEDQPGFFRQTYLPPPRLVLAGGDPVTLALCRLAPSLGYEVALLRPYGPETTPAGTDIAYYDNRPIQRALADLSLDYASAVYTLSHDIATDHAVLAAALASPAFCVGALGSRHKTAQRLALLRRDGFDEHSLQRLRTPAGLAIGARDPFEIALSIVAELSSHRPRPPAP